MIGLESSIASEPDYRPDQLGVEKLTIKVLSYIGAIDFIWKLVTDGQTHILLIVEVLWVESVRIVVLAVCHSSVQFVIGN